MGYGIDFISIHLERGEGLYPRILYSDVIFCLQAGGPVTGRGGGGVRSKGGSEVRGAVRSKGGRLIQAVVDSIWFLICQYRGGKRVRCCHSLIVTLTRQTYFSVLCLFICVCRF